MSTFGNGKAMINASLQSAVLDRIAAGHGIALGCLAISDKDVVFYRRGEEMVCLCKRGSLYWDEMEAEVITVEAIKRAARH